MRRAGQILARGSDICNSTALALPPRPTEVRPPAYTRACACMAVAMARGARKDRAAQAAACTAREALAPSFRLQKGGRARMRARVQFRVLALGLVYTKVVTCRPQKYVYLYSYLRAAADACCSFPVTCWLIFASMRAPVLPCVYVM